ncbi:MAG TPA: AraC family transcriptional regulator [Parapedobacter sp.]|uniref:AraC family transcriptional regulator n=1 Tax=Parapedobacter sp. TaxID=1958893 RepID=UPI002D176BB7|nr:AraC family transcriptional regulator [Parapedobacter sp.]HWK57653.1 AraC family transcriptional regulator [Parapedobacter sp.]
MKPQLLKVSFGPAQSFSVRQDSEPSINNKWHYHQELELIHFNKGEGMQFIGDSMRRFNQGDILLVGSYLPHYWRFDDMYFERRYRAPVDVRVAHFREDLWGSCFINLPENRSLRDILERSKRGLKINGRNNATVARLLAKMLHANGAQRLIILTQILVEIAGKSDVEQLSSVGFQSTVEQAEEERLKDVYAYSYRNFRKRIPLDEIAEIANVSPNSFCRFFKSRTQKTYSQFLTEIKVGQACKLLIENQLNVKQVCFSSGFNNFTSFYKSFKDITGKSPLNYQKEYVNP